jgi:signal transduction histidine kinase
MTPESVASPMVVVAPAAGFQPIEPVPRRGLLERLLGLRQGSLAALYGVISFTILVALTGSALLFGGDAVRDQVNRGLGSSAGAGASYLDLSLRARADVLVAFAGRPTLRTALAARSVGPADQAYAADLLEQLRASTDGAYSAWLTTASGTVVAVSPAQPSLLGQDFAYRDWFAGALTATGAYLSRAYVSAAVGQPLVVAEATRVSDADGRVLGVLGVAYDLARLQQFVDSFQALSGTRLLVADQGGTLVVRPGGGLTALVAASEPGVSAGLQGRSGRDDHDPATLAAYAPLPWAHWALVAQVPTAEALAGLGVMQRAVLLTAGLLALLNGGMVLLLYGALRRRAAAEAAVTEANQRLEQRVAERTAQLEAANRELEAFSYSVSHDLRAPLRSIDAFSRILLEEHTRDLDAEARRVLGVVVRNTRQMGVLIDDLLAFSRVGRKELERRPVDMERLARSVAEELQTAEPGRGLMFELHDLCPAIGDQALLRQVWTNLLANAAKFTRPVADARVAVSCELTDGECRYQVRDNGVGFDGAYADKLFRPFQRLHPTTDFEGTGIGLAIVARIIERHGGRVWAEGTPGRGATFGFALPAARET